MISACFALQWETISTAWNEVVLLLQGCQNFSGEAFNHKSWRILQKLLSFLFEDGDNSREKWFPEGFYEATKMSIPGYVRRVQND